MDYSHSSHPNSSSQIEVNLQNVAVLPFSFFLIRGSFGYYYFVYPSKHFQSFLITSYAETYPHILAGNLVCN